MYQVTFKKGLEQQLHGIAPIFNSTFGSLSYTSKSILICQKNANSALLDCKITKSSFSGLFPAGSLFMKIILTTEHLLLSWSSIFCTSSKPDYCPQWQSSHFQAQIIRLPPFIWLLVPKLNICHCHHGQENTLFSSVVLCSQFCPPWLSPRALHSRSARREEAEMRLFSHPA